VSECVCVYMYVCMKIQFCVGCYTVFLGDWR